jgi:alpha-tubulin suppressor-like RCC1 family protein
MRNTIGFGISAVMLMLSASGCRTDVTVIELCKPPATASEPSVIVAGNDHACALMADSTVRCWGSNAWGQLGTGSLEDQLRPAPVRGLSNVAQIAAGGYNTCARMIDGTVRCWGDNAYCQVGSDVGGAGGTQSPRGRGGLDPDIVSPNAVEVPGVRDAVQLALDGLQACALLSDGTVRCWGRHFTMTDPRDSNRHAECERSVVTVPSLTNVVSIRATTRSGMCATRSDGSVACWFRSYGLGPSWGTPVQVPPPPTLIAGVSNAASALRLHAMTTLERRPALETSCVLLADHTVSCAGENAVGMLGDGTRSSRTTFAPVASVSDAVRIASFGERVCAQRSTGALVCWGESYYRTPSEQLAMNPEQCPIGDRPTPCATVPREQAGVSGVRDIAMGEMFTCVYTSDGAVRCSGINAFGELGNGERSDRLEDWQTVQF